MIKIEVIWPRIKGGGIVDAPTPTAAKIAVAMAEMIRNRMLTGSGPITIPKPPGVKSAVHVLPGYPGGVGSSKSPAPFVQTLDAQGGPLRLHLGVWRNGQMYVRQVQGMRGWYRSIVTGGMWGAFVAAGKGTGLQVRAYGKRQAKAAFMGRSDGRNPYNHLAGEGLTAKDPHKRSRGRFGASDRRKYSVQPKANKVNNALKAWSAAASKESNPLEYSDAEMRAVVEALEIIASQQVDHALSASADWHGAAPSPLTLDALAAMRSA